MGLHEKILEAIIQARKNLSKDRCYEITPADPVCGFIARDVESQVGSKRARNIKFDVPGTPHQVIRAKKLHHVYDPQFKQFVPRLLRPFLPDTLVLDEHDDVEQQLRKHGVPRKIAKPYAEALKKK